MKTLSELKIINTELNSEISANEASLENINRRENKAEYKALSRIIRDQNSVSCDLSSVISQMTQLNNAGRDANSVRIDSGCLIDFLATK